MFFLDVMGSHLPVPVYFSEGDNYNKNNLLESICVYQKPNFIYHVCMCVFCLQSKNKCSKSIGGLEKFLHTVSDEDQPELDSDSGSDSL